MMMMEDMVHAHVTAQVPALNGRAAIEMGFSVPAKSNRREWGEMAYEWALLMFDPA